VSGSNANGDSAFTDNNWYINVHTFADNHSFTDANQYPAYDHVDTIRHTNGYAYAHRYTAVTNPDRDGHANRFSNHHPFVNTCDHNAFTDAGGHTYTHADRYTYAHANRYAAYTDGYKRTTAPELHTG
jgi:hypothetical protein